MLLCPGKRGHSRVHLLFLIVFFLFPILSGAQAPVDRIEINQALGVQKNNALKFVAGKDAVVRAFLASPVTVDKTLTKADITKDGQLVATLDPNTYDGPTAIIDFQCPNRQACGNWGAGNYVFT